MSDEELISFLGILITRRQWWLFFWIFLTFGIAGVSLVLIFVNPEGRQGLWLSRSAWFSAGAILVETTREQRRRRSRHVSTYREKNEIPAPNQEKASDTIIRWVTMYFGVLLMWGLFILGLIFAVNILPLHDIKGPDQIPSTPRVPRFWK